MGYLRVSRPWETTCLSVSGLLYYGEERRYELLNTFAIEVRDPNEYANPVALLQYVTRLLYA